MSDYSWNSNPWVWALTFRRVNEPPSGKQILFTGPMVRAILRKETPKTQTRRVIDLSRQGYDSPQPAADATWARYINDRWEWWGPRTEDGRALLYQRDVICPYGKPGDRLWVREMLRRPDGEPWLYEADKQPVMVSREDEPAMLTWAHHKEQDYCTSMFMPKWASRITLEITEVRVQRVQEISGDDVLAEGCELVWGDRQTLGTDEERARKNLYGQLWDSINGKRGPKRVKVAA